MKNKLTGFAVVCVLVCGLPGFGSDEHEAKSHAYDEQVLKILREIVRLYANFKVIRDWDPFSDEVVRSSPDGCWTKAEFAAWGTACAVTSFVPSNTPANQRPLCYFNLLRRDQATKKIIEKAIFKAKIDVLPPENLKLAMMRFLDLSRRRLADEYLSQAIPGMRQYYLEEIAAVMALYAGVASPSDENCCAEKFDDFFMAIMPAGCQAFQDFREKKKGAHRQAMDGAAFDWPTPICGLVFDYAEADGKLFIEYVQAAKRSDTEGLVNKNRWLHGVRSFLSVIARSARCQ